MADTPTRVMFIEDEATLRKSYERFFADRYSMEFAASGAEAVTKVRPFAPEVVVLDLRLPDTDGIEVMRQVREIDPRCPSSSPRRTSACGLWSRCSRSADVIHDETIRLERSGAEDRRSSTLP